jgi:hypothetical protein
MRELFAFLGVEEVFQPDLSTAHNSSGRPAFRVLMRLMRSRNPVRRGARACTTLEMREAVARRLQSWNRTPRGSPSPGARRELRRLYREDVFRLQDLIGRDLSDWLSEAASTD